MSMFAEHDWPLRMLRGQLLGKSHHLPFWDPSPGSTPLPVCPPSSTSWGTCSLHNKMTPFILPHPPGHRSIISPCISQLRVCVCVCICRTIIRIKPWLWLCIFKLFIVSNFTHNVAKITDDSHIAFIQNNHLFLHFTTFVWLLWLLFSEPFEIIEFMPLLYFECFIV